MTAWMWAVLACAVSLIAAALGDLVSEELRGWLDLAPNAILRLAATFLDPAQRETIYQDEWLPELCYILRGTESRPITRLIRGTAYAAGLFISARRIARISDRVPRTPASTAADDPAATAAQYGRRSARTHKGFIDDIPGVTGREIREWMERVESGPTFGRISERARWLADEEGLTHGYASAIVHEYEVQRRRRSDPDLGPH